jgi:hypothetical protein
MRRLSLMVVLIVALAGCSSGSSNVTGTAPADTAGSAATDGSAAGRFCAAFPAVKAAKSATTPKAAGAAFQSAAADMRAYAPASIKAATETYAELIDSIGKDAQAGTIDQQGLLKALSTGMAEKAADVATVAIWVSKNCPR